MSGDGRLPEDLHERLQLALGLGLAESRKALRLLLESVNGDLKGQVASILTPVDADSLRFFESTSDVFRAEDFPVVPITSSIAGFVFLSGQSMGLDNAQQSSRFYAEIDERSGFHTKEYLATPVTLGKNVLGVLTVANRNEPLDNPLFTRAELLLADRYARLCGLVLDHEGHLRRHTAAMSAALDAFFAGDGDGRSPASDRFFGSGGQARVGDLRAQVKDALDLLAERDLELVRDLAERLSDLTEGNLS